MPYLCLLEIHLHLPEGGSLKGKRKELLHLKSGLQRRFGAAVAETDHHELWQRSTLSAALVGRTAQGVAESADALERWLHSNFPGDARVERALVSREDVLG